MPNYAIFDSTSAPVANRVRQYLRSVPESITEGRADAVLCASLPGELSECVVDNGVVRVMTPEELAAVDAAVAAQTIEAEVMTRPYDELNRKRNAARRELETALRNWPALTQEQINATTKNLIIALV